MRAPHGWRLARPRLGPWLLGRHIRRGFLAVTIMGLGACSAPGHDIYDDFNTRDTGRYVSLSRVMGGDGALLLHVAAERPEHGRELAWELVRLSYASAPTSVRVVVDPMGDGPRQVYRWNGGDLRVDTSTEGLPPREPAPGQPTSRP